MAKHYIITNRQIYNEGRRNERLRRDGKEEARDELRFGTYEFDESNSSDKGKVTLLRDLSEKEALKAYDKQASTKLPSNRVFSELYNAMSSTQVNRHVLVFIHGFKSDLDGSLETMRTLHKEYVENPDSPVEHIVMFTWPARSQLLKYRDDARDAVISGYALGRGIQKLKEFFKLIFGTDPANPKSPICNQKIHLMVHSMGNKVLEAMFQQMLSENNTITSIFNEAILVGADVDYIALEKPNPLNHLIDICDRVNVYYHNKDMALKVSETTKNAFNRLGKFGPRQSNLLPDDVLEVNVTNINDDDGLINNIHHWYYNNSPTVIKDICKVLNGESMENRKL